MGIAERETEADNAAYTYMAAVVVLRDAIYAADYAAEKIGSRRPAWPNTTPSSGPTFRPL